VKNILGLAGMDSLIQVKRKRILEANSLFGYISKEYLKILKQFLELNGSIQHLMIYFSTNYGTNSLISLNIDGVIKELELNHQV
jgi:hypothetical protein